MPPYLNHLSNEDYAAIWANLTALGSDIVNEPAYSEAKLVANTFARRARRTT